MRINDKQVLAELLRRMADQIDGNADCYVAAQFEENPVHPEVRGVHVVDGRLEPIIVGYAPRTQTLTLYLHFLDDEQPVPATRSESVDSSGGDQSSPESVIPANPGHFEN